MIKEVNSSLDQIINFIIPGANTIDFKIQLLIGFIIIAGPMFLKLIFGGLKKFYDWLIPNEMTLKISLLGFELYMYGYKVFYIFIGNLFFSSIISAIISAVFTYFVYTSSFISRWLQPILYMVISAIIIFFTSSLVAKNKNFKQTKNKYFEGNINIATLMVIINPIVAYLCTWMVLGDSVLNTIGKYSFIVYIIIMILNLVILACPKRYKRYKRVSITLPNQTTIFMRYDQFRKDKDSVIRTLKKGKKDEKRIIYPIYSIIQIKYFLDENIDENYDLLLRKRYEKLSFKPIKKPKKNKIVDSVT